MTWLVTRLSCNYINTLASVLREIRGIGLTATECTPVYIDHMTCEEGDARPKRLAKIAPKRFWGLRPVVAMLLRPNRMRFVELEFSSSSETLLNKKGPLRDPFLFSCAPEEIRTPDLLNSGHLLTVQYASPSTRFEVRSLYRNLLF